MILTLLDVARVRDIMDVAGVMNVADVTDVTDITDVAGVTGVTDITGGTVRHMAFLDSTRLGSQRLRLVRSLPYSTVNDVYLTLLV